MIRRRILVVFALGALIALSMPRYIHSFGASAYANAAQMVALVWLGFFAAARYWVKDDPQFVRILLGIAAIVCVPPLVYHLYDSHRLGERVGNFALLAGILSYSYGLLIRREPIRPKSRQ
jgi:uncharacterized membrane protein YoaK (UPF0700 family)